MTFTETAKAAGLAFRHETGAFGDKWMPETMGSGCALHDLDGDGDDDALLVNGAWWPGREGEGPAPTSALFANDGAGSFTDATAGSGVDVSVYGMGVTAADYDADGDADLYLTTLGANLLLRQERPLRFVDVAAQAGVAGELWTGEDGGRHPEWSTGAAWADVDADGRPDLLVTNYVHWSPANDLYASFDGKSKSYATPQQYTGSTPRLYRNRGDGAFLDITEEAGLLLPHAKSMGVAADDFDADGRVDLVITNDTQPNFLLRNLGGGRFEEVGTAAGIGYDESGRARAGMGVDVADLAGDGRPGHRHRQLQPRVPVPLPADGGGRHRLPRRGRQEPARAADPADPDLRPPVLRLRPGRPPGPDPGQRPHRAGDQRRAA